VKTHQTHKLVNTGIEALPAGLHHDGCNLYLQVTVNKITELKRRSWIYRYRTNGRSHDMGLGSYPKIGLSNARKLAEGVAATLVQGIDPIEARRTQRAAKRDSNPATAMTLKRAVGTYLSIKKSKWTKKQKDKWEEPIRLHAYPKFGDKHLGEITSTIMRVIIEPLWGTKQATAQKLRAKLFNILGWAMYMGHIKQGPNPAEWKNALDTHFEVNTDENNRASMSWHQVPAFIKKLEAKTTITAKAFKFLILTATRTNEVLEAEWSEIDLDKKLWTISKARMKSNRDHVVPLSELAMQILHEMQEIKVSNYIFPGTIDGEPMDQTILRYLKNQMGYSEITVHGFRSSFRTWADDETDAVWEIKEACIAHKIPSRTERAYARGSFLEKRKVLMDAWAIHLTNT
jgi:integrase